MMTTCFWGINIENSVKRYKAKTIILYAVLSYEAYYEEPYMKEQLQIMYPNNEIHIHFVKWEEYEQLKDVKEFKQS